MNQKWTVREKEYIRANANKKSDEDMAKELTKLTGRKISTAALRKYRQRLGIKKVGGRGNINIV